MEIYQETHQHPLNTIVEAILVRRQRTLDMHDTSLSAWQQTPQRTRTNPTPLSHPKEPAPEITLPHTKKTAKNNEQDRYHSHAADF